MQRLRRLRRNMAFRELIAETSVKPRGLILPVFVCEGQGLKQPVPSMPGVFRYSVDRLEEIADAVRRSGIGGVMLFGVPDHKDEEGSGAYDENGVVQRALRFLRAYLKRTGAEFLLIADICLCEYTSHGHCGVLCDGSVDNDRSLPLHAAAALSCVKAGADMVAPSSMMDGVVAATPDRSRLFAVQTPQVFDIDLLRGALQAAMDAGIAPTDDCGAVERLGKQVMLTRGSYENIKITTPEDLVLAQAIWDAREEG